MNERYSYKIIFGLKNGEERELMFEDATEAEESFDEQADETNPDHAKLYNYAELVKIDWYARSKHELKSVSF